MNIIFKKMTIDNFMSFDKEEFNFDEHKGLTLITGINNDIPGSKNGCGKCVDRHTMIDIKIDDPVIKKLFKDM